VGAEADQHGIWSELTDLGEEQRGILDVPEDLDVGTSPQ
jgi:hypothetical protein